jgi:SARP family transcriptional regulator, regulator of embCAB operon
VEYEILGPLHVKNTEGSVLIRAQKMEIVLAALLIRAGQVVSAEQLIGEVWGESPPRRAMASVYVYISQLRKLLSGPGQRENPIATTARGYTLSADPSDLDLHHFLHLTVQGRQHISTGRYEDARIALETALATCRGPVLSELRNGPIVNGFVAWFEEMRLECIEMLIEANFRLSRHRELISFLRVLVREHPFNEAFYHQLMLALWRSERRADALGVYRSARETLRSELGLEPDRQLRELHQAILSSAN